MTEPHDDAPTGAPESEEAPDVSVVPDEADDAQDVEEGGGVAFLDPDPATASALGQVRDLEARLRTVSAAYKQLQEEMTLARARMERQGILQREVQRGELVATLFEPLENFRRSMQAIAGDETVSADAKEGLAHVSKQFLKAFTDLGLEETGAVGVLFDPTQHEAIAMVTVTDPEEDGVVKEVFSVGYRIGSRLLRPARVVIGKIEEPAGEA